jgi:acetyl esterase/lipase
MKNMKLTTGVSPRFEVMARKGAVALFLSACCAGSLPGGADGKLVLQQCWGSPLTRLEAPRELLRLTGAPISERSTAFAESHSSSIITERSDGAQPVALETCVFPLWPGAAPGALDTTVNDIPTMTVYLPAKSSKKTGSISGATIPAMVIFPGGSYRGLTKQEGEGLARWFTANGVAGFVVRYRLGKYGYRHPTMLQDATRAVRLVRARAAEWNVDPARVGVIGSSAGGHLASTILTHFDPGHPDNPDAVERQSSRPDTGVLCYPVITMGQGTHRGSRLNLLGETPSPELIEFLSNEKQVTKQTPPCFIWHTWEDTTVRAENSINFAQALRANGVRFELHIYEKGKHGFGLGLDNNNSPQHRWRTDCLAWLKEVGFIQ